MRRNSIAIIGMSCRIPGGANSPAALWQLLKEGREAIREPPEGRWDPNRWFHPDPKKPSKMYSQRGGYLDDLDMFDAAFFGISPREATQMDPQQRLLLEMAWEALEDAGQVPKKLAGTNTGVFIGVSSLEYGSLPGRDTDTIDVYTNTGAALSISANRLSYIFDLHGPSFALDTACSSSLIAIHQACQSIWRGESSMALAGGVNVLLRPEPGVGFCKASMLSKSGRIRTFDAGADGFVRAEGGGLLLLKPAAKALADGDPIQALILATGANNDGRTTGIFLPNQAAQAELLRGVLNQAAVAASDICYVEAHGTGTPVGDPIECAAIGNVIGAERDSTTPCLIGSIKTNVGHLEAASGVAGTIKAVLSMSHREVTPLLNFETPNPTIPFTELNLEVVNEPKRLRNGRKPLAMAVNSFGFGGANATIVLEEHKRRRVKKRQLTENGILPLILSARSSESLLQLAREVEQLLRRADRAALYDICHSLAFRRARLSHRLVVFGASADELAGKLAAALEGDYPETAASEIVLSERAKLAVVFSGNGSQWWGMAHTLLEQEPTFRATIEKINSLLEPVSGWSLLEELRATEETSRLDLTEIAQPALFAVQVGIVELLRSWGVKSDAVLGHSVGEVAAAYAASALSLEQAVQVIYKRSKGQARTAGMGKMAAANVSAEEAEALIEPYENKVLIAGINSPMAVTLTGDETALLDLGRKLEKENIFFRLLDLNYAFHSEAMDALHQPLLDSLEMLSPGDATVKFVSTVTGDYLEGSELTANYWWENVRRPVKFQAAVDRLLDDGFEVFLEIGPHAILSNYVKDCIIAKDAQARVLSTLRREKADRNTLLTAVASCHALGCDVDFNPFFPEHAQYHALPSYPWQRERYWIDHSFERPDHPLLGDRLETADPTWSQRLDTPLVSYLNDHVVHKVAVMPAAGFLEMALAAAHVLHNGAAAYEINDVELYQPLVLSQEKSPFVQLSVSPADGSFTIRSRTTRGDQPWTTNVVGKLGVAASNKPPAPISVNEIVARMTYHFAGNGIHGQLALQHGLQYGPAFQGIAEVWGNDTEGLVRIDAPEVIASGLSDYHLHPALLDACFQGMLGMLVNEQDDATWLPVRVGRLRFLGNSSGLKYCYLRLEREGVRSKIAALRILDGEGNVIAEIDGFRAQQVDLTRGASPTAIYEWQPQYQPSKAPVIISSPMPSPGKIGERMNPTLTKMIAEWKRKEIHERFKTRTDLLCAAYVARAFEQLGAREKPFTAESLIQERGVLPQYKTVLGRFIEMLSEDGIIARDNGKWLFRPDAQYPDPDTAWREFAADSPNALAELLIASECGEQLATLLTGEIDPLQIFNQSPIEHLYESAPITGFYNHLAREVAIELVRDWPRDRPLRVLEIGAGTGGVTGYIAPVLPKYRTHYLFTDISELLLARAEPRFAQFPFIHFQKLDIERDPLEQGLVAGSFDLIIASFVIHATRDLRQSLRHVRRLLSKNGQLLLLEVHDQRRLLHLLFGLLKGWTAFTDTDLRSKSPLLEPEQWKDVLEEVGFDECTIINDAENGSAPSQSLILSRNPQVESTAEAKDEGLPLRRWLVFLDNTDSAELGRDLVSNLKAEGHQVVTVEPDTVFAQIHETSFVLPVTSKDAYDELLAALGKSNFVCDEVLHLWGLTDAFEASSSELFERTDRRSASLILLLQAMRRAWGSEMPRLSIVTSGAVVHPAHSSTATPGQAPAWGLGRVIQNYTSCRLIDIQPGKNPSETRELLLEELRRPHSEDEILLVNGFRFVNRIRRTSVEDETEFFKHLKGTAEPQAFRLDFSSPGTLDALYVRSMPLAQPGPGQVLIKVRATALNFHDVLWVMGLLPGEAVENGFAGPGLGMECAGEIVAIGENVEGFSVGQAVLAFGSYCLASHAMVDARVLLPKPSQITFEEAATVPTVFLTAFYALDTLAQIQPGERLLIHGAAGGVGLAAIQIAMLKGVEVFGTAGSPQKRRFLKRMGVDYVLDSRSLAFADDIMEITGGEGVDVVLNSLAGEAIYRNLKVLKPFGRFLEIGRRDHFANTKMGLRPFSNNLSYFGIDVDQLMLERPDIARRVFHQVIDMFKEGVLRPLVHRVFPVSRAVDAFRHMQQGGHIGKVVISMDDKGIRVRSAEKKSLTVREDGTYLITGGLGGFGIATARWLVEKGARNLVLLGRKGASTEEAKVAVAELQEAGVRVVVASSDVTNESDLRQVFETIETDLPPLRGIVHAVLVIEDVSPFEIDQEQWQRVLEPKVRGAWNLHHLTSNKPLDFFIMYSSAATLIGSPGQPNYAAANLYLETLAAYRRSLGLPGLAVAWGAIGDVGYVARGKEVKELLHRRGLKTISSSVALDTLERLVVADAVNVTVAEIDWPRLFKTLQAADQPKYDYVRGEGSDLEEGEIEDLTQWLAEIPAEERLGKVTQLLAERLAKVLRTSPAKIDLKKSILEMGVDSLMTVELATIIQNQFGVTLPVMKLIGNVSLTDIATTILSEVATATSGEGSTPRPVESAPAATQAQREEALEDSLVGQELSYSEQSKCSSYLSRGAITAEDVWFHQVGAVSLRPRLDVERLAAAFQTIVEHHAALRTTYPMRGRRRRRLISAVHPTGLEVFESASLSDTELLELLKARAEGQFDLAEGPLFSLQLYHRADDTDVLFMRFHEIVADGWSMVILSEDLFTAYLAPGELRSTQTPYSDFVRWQTDLVASEKGAAQLEYWRRKLRQPGPPLKMPFDRPRQPGSELKVGTRSFNIDAETVTALSRLAAANETTRYAALLAVFKLVLYAFTGSTDLIVTSVFSGRTRPEFHRIVGSMSRRGWLRTTVVENQSFEMFLQGVAQAVREGLEHQDYPASLIFEAVRPDYESMLDQVGFSVGWPEQFDDTGLGSFVVSPPGTVADYAGFHVESLPIRHSGGLRDLHVLVHSFGERVYCQVKYNSDLFEVGTIDRLISTYQTFARAVVADPTQTLLCTITSS